MIKITKMRNVLILIKTMTSCRITIAKMSNLTRHLNEISRTIYYVEKINDKFFQNFLKKNF
jgi:hypothetical protein